MRRGKEEHLDAKEANHELEVVGLSIKNGHESHRMKVKTCSISYSFCDTGTLCALVSSSCQGRPGASGLAGLLFIFDDLK